MKDGKKEKLTDIRDEVDKKQKTNEKTNSTIYEARGRDSQNVELVCRRQEKRWKVGR